MTIRELPPLPNDGDESERAKMLKEMLPKINPKSEESDPAFCDCEPCQMIQQHISLEEIEQQEALVPDGYSLFSLLLYTQNLSDKLEASVPGWCVYTKGSGFVFWSEAEALMIILRIPHLLPILTYSRIDGTIRIIYLKLDNNTIVDKETLDRRPNNG